MWKRLFRVRRYFFISYSHENGFGHMTVWTRKGIFPRIESCKDGSGEKQVIIINITEMSKRDFLDLTTTKQNQK